MKNDSSERVFADDTVVIVVIFYDFSYFECLHTENIIMNEQKASVCAENGITRPMTAKQKT